MTEKQKNIAEHGITDRAIYWESWLKTTPDAEKIEKLIAMEKFTKDPLTGLPRREVFADNFEKFTPGVFRRGNRIYIILADLNQLKTINDQFGHAAGDLYVKKGADAISVSLRGSDSVYRWGGDEFLALVEIDKGDNDEDVIKLIDRILDQAKKYEVSFSIGLAEFKKGDDVEKTIEIADARMYVDKRG